VCRGIFDGIGALWLGLFDLVDPVKCRLRRDAIHVGTGSAVRRSARRPETPPKRPSRKRGELALLGSAGTLAQPVRGP
jgi:hypothetical protein